MCCIRCTYTGDSSSSSSTTIRLNQDNCSTLLYSILFNQLPLVAEPYIIHIYMHRGIHTHTVCLFYDTNRVASYKYLNVLIKANRFFKKKKKIEVN